MTPALNHPRVTRTAVAGFLTTCCCGLQLVAADPVQLVKDLSTGTLGSAPGPVVSLSGTLFFAADDGVHDRELWSLDTATGSRRLVKDIGAPQFGGCNPTEPTVVGDTLFFYCPYGWRGLWKTDGTEAGTVLVKETYFDFGLLTAVGRTLFFVSGGPGGTSELWRSDGSGGGTVRVWQGDPIVELTVVGSTIYFQARATSVSRNQLWKSDGTAAGTVLVANIYASELTPVGDILFFSSNELWKSDGTAAGTVMVKDIDPGWASGPRWLTDVNGTLFFSASDGLHGVELWRSDGTAAGTVMVKDIDPAVSPWPASSDPQDLVSVGGRLFFSASTGVTGRELWVSDGTAGGTALVADIVPGEAGSKPDSITDVAGTAYFVVDDGVHGVELWRSDGTPGGTGLVRDICGGAPGSVPRELSAEGATLYFTADDGYWGSELWRSDGTADGTWGVDINVQPREEAVPGVRVSSGGSLFFGACIGEGTSTCGLWRSDGTGAGTVLVKNLSASVSDIEDVTGVVYFVAGFELWRTDGAGAATRLVRQFPAWVECSGWRPPICVSHTPFGLTNASGGLYFAAGDATTGYELWQSDGTAEGTTLVREINPGAASSVTRSLTAVGRTVYFAAHDGVHGEEVWKSDGTDAGTVMVRDINPGTASSGPRELVELAGAVYFSADDGVAGRELWKSDGTADGTVLVKDVRDGAGSSDLGSLTGAGGTLFFRADDGVSGYELWKSDGTARGTVLVKDISSFSGLWSEPQLTAVGGTLFFVADDSITGPELWKSDGTAPGTVLVKDMRVGSAPSSARNLTSAAGTLFLSADDGEHGAELWRSAGTPAGTNMLVDLRAGTAGSEPGLLTDVGGTLFFFADDGVHGTALWKVASTPSGPVLSTIPAPLVVGAPNTVSGANFTPGSVVKLYVATAGGAVAYGPYAPVSWTSTQLNVAIPADVRLENGFAAVQVINTDDGYKASNVVPALLLGSAAAGIPSVTHINGAALAPADLSVALAHVDTVVGKGETLTITGTGFVDPVVNVFTASGNIGPIAPLPGGTATRIQVTLPVSAPTGPGNVQVVNRPSYRASNAVSSVIGAVPTITSVTVADGTITVAGTGFSTLAVVNLFNLQGGTVVNLGGYGPDGLPKVPLTIVNDAQLTFGRPATAVAGPALVEVLNPPFIPFSSSVADPDGAFTMPGPAPFWTGALPRGDGDGRALKDRVTTGYDGRAAEASEDRATTGDEGRNPAWTREVVRWTRAVGAAIEGGTLRSSADDAPDATLGAGSSLGGRRSRGAWTSGARSTRALLEGDGYVTWTVRDGAGDVAFGFGHTDRDGGLADLDFAWRLDATTRELLVYEGGRRQAAVGRFVAADRLRIAVRDGVVEYRRNGTLVWTSTQVPQYPLIVDASLGSPGAVLRGVRLAGRLGTVVEWLAQAGVATASMRVTARIAVGAAGPVVLGPATPGGAGAAMTRAVSADLVGAAGIGFGARDCDYCIVRAGGAVRVRHAGTVRGTWPVAPATLVRVEIDAAGLVRYWAGDARLDEAPLDAAAPLGVQGWLGAPDAAITGATVTDGGRR